MGRTRTAEQMASLVKGMNDFERLANEEFFRNTWSMLKLGGRYFWPDRATWYEKVTKGFKELPR
jgi:hypothetical protein